MTSENRHQKMTLHQLGNPTDERVGAPLLFFCGHSDFKSGQSLQVDMLSTGCSQEMKKSPIVHRLVKLIRVVVTGQVLPVNPH